MTVLLVAVGAAVGAPLRHLVNRAVTGRGRGGLPWGTLLVNVAGAALLGLLAGLVAAGVLGSRWEAGVGIGFCGALTTFSTFGYETLRLADDGAAAATVNVVANVAGGLLAVMAGFALAGAW